MFTRGLDVSKYQGTIDWNLVAGGDRHFTFVRAGDGLYVDPLFADDYRRAQDVGLIRGAYLFFREGIDPVKQADLLLDAVGDHLAPGDLPVTIDAETLNGHKPPELIDALHVFLEEIRQTLDDAPILYTSPGFWDALPASDLDGALVLWVAHWGVLVPRLPRGWTDWAFWQNTNRELTPGIRVPDDGDQWNGDLASLQAFVGVGATMPAPAPVPTPTLPSPPDPTPAPAPDPCVWKPMPQNQVTHGIEARAVELLGIWRGRYTDADAQAGWVHCDEWAPTGSPVLYLRYIFAWHPPDVQNHAWHSGVDVRECVSGAPARS
jgi:lysozyme